MTKEQRREYDKAYYKANRDKILSQKIAYQEVNSQRIAERRKSYYRANSKEILSKDKLKRESLKDSFYTLYYLREEHYVGVTNQPKLRLKNHKKSGKHTIDYEAITTFNTKREALDAERHLHSIGYNGGNPRNFKNNYEKAFLN